MSRVFKSSFSFSVLLAAALIALVLGILGGRIFAPAASSASGSGSVPASGKKIDVIVKATDSAFWQAMLAGSQKAGKDWGLQIGLFGATSEADIADQVRLVENSISRNVNAIVLAASSTQALNNVIDRARSQNIKVITVDNQVTTTSDGFIGTDNVKAGAQAAD